MRHRKKGNKLGVRKSIRKSVLRNLVIALFRNEEVKTTLSRAKEARRLAARLITYAKKGTLHHQRLAFSILRDKEIIQKLFKDLAERYKTREGGYTRIYKLGFRKGDGAEVASWQLVDKMEKKAEKKKAAPKEDTKPVEEKEINEEPQTESEETPKKEEE